MNALVAYNSPPRLSPALRVQVERLIAGPSRCAGIAGTDDPGLLLAPAPAIFDPDAGPAAAALRVVLERPADDRTIADWLSLLVACGTGGAPASAGEFGLRLSAVRMICGDLPAAVWTEDTARLAGRRFRKYWPSAGEIWELLDAYHARLKAEIAALDDIANGVRSPVGPARESTVPYKPKLAEREQKPGVTIHEPEITNPEQIAVVDAEAKRAAEAAIAALWSPAEIEASRQAFMRHHGQQQPPPAPLARAPNDNAPPARLSNIETT